MTYSHNRFDYGRVSNLRRYGTPDPPEYDLARVKVPTSLYVGAADDLGSPEDARELARHLSNAGALAEHKLVGGPTWGHLHFAFSSEAGVIVNADIAKSMAATDAYLFLSQHQQR